MVADYRWLDQCWTMHLVSCHQQMLQWQPALAAAGANAGGAWTAVILGAVACLAAAATPAPLFQWTLAQKLQAGS